VVWKGLRVRASVHAGAVHSAQGAQVEHVVYSGHVIDLTIKLGRAGLPGQSIISDYVRKIIVNTGI
jgi:hypothetical protein